MKHSEVRQEVSDWCSLNGWERFPIGASVFGTNGLPDDIIVKDGRHVWIECKAGKDTQTKEQLRTQARLEESGGEYLIVRKYEDMDILKACKHLKEVRNDYPISAFDTNAALLLSMQNSQKTRPRRAAKGNRKKA